MSKRLLSLVFVLLCALPACAQYTPVSGSLLHDGSGNLFSSAQVCFLPVDPTTSRPISFNVNVSYGLALPAPTSCGTVTNGVLTSGFKVADSNLTHPQNVAYIIQTTDNLSGDVYSVGPTQISCTMTPTPSNCSGGTWSLDGYVPSSTALGLVWAGSYTLPAAAAGAIGGVYAKDCSTLGSSYVVQKINTDGTETCVLVSTITQANSDWNSTSGVTQILNKPSFVTTINGWAGAFTFSGPGVWCASGACTFSGGGATSAQVVAAIAGQAIAPSSVSTGAPSTAAKAALANSRGFICDETTTVGTPAAGVDYMRCDSVTHKFVYSCNGSAESTTPCGGASSGGSTAGLSNSVLGDTNDALIVDGTSIPRGNMLGAGGWGTLNTAASGNCGPCGASFGYNPKVTTPLTGLATYAYKATQLPALKGKVGWVQNLSYDGTDSSHVSGDMATVTALCSQAGTTYGHVFYIPDAGTNDFGGSLSFNCSAGNASQVLSGMQTIWQTAHNAGCSVLATTVMQRQFAPGYTLSYNTGYVTASAGVVTWSSGNQFNTSVNGVCGTGGGTPLAVGDTMYINGSPYTITAYTSATSVTVVPSFTQASPVPYVAGQEIERQVYNRAVRSLIGKGYFDYLVDFDTAMNNNADSFWSTDGIHPTDAGHTVMAAEINKVLMEGSNGTPIGTMPMSYLDYWPTLLTNDNFHVPSTAAVTAYHSSHGMNLLGSLTTTAATTNAVAVTGMTASGHCVLTPTNSAAASNLATTYVSAKAANSITVTHTATAGMTYDVACSAN